MAYICVKWPARSINIPPSSQPLSFAIPAALRAHMEGIVCSPSTASILFPSTKLPSS